MKMQSGVFKKYDPLEDLDRYTADELAKLSSDEMERYYIAKSPSFNVIFLKDDNGNDWYQWLRTLSKETLKISFNPNSKEIIHFSYDASTIFPLNQIVIEIAPENVPDEFTDAGENALGGTFIFKDGKIIAAPVDHVAEARSKKKELLTQANNVISTLQDAVDLSMSTEEENSSLVEWKRYRVLLSRVDPNKPDWPLKPTQ